MKNLILTICLVLLANTVLANQGCWNADGCYWTDDLEIIFHNIQLKPEWQHYYAPPNEEPFWVELYWENDFSRLYMGDKDNFVASLLLPTANSSSDEAVLRLDYGGYQTPMNYFYSREVILICCPTTYLNQEDPFSMYTKPYVGWAEVSPIPLKCPWIQCCKFDYNSDGIVNLDDYNLFLETDFSVSELADFCKCWLETVGDCYETN